MNELEKKALGYLKSKKLNNLKKLPKEELNFKNNMLIYRAISDNKYSFFKYLISIKEVKDIFDIKHAFLLTVHHHNNDSITNDIINMSNKNIILNKKENTYLLETLIKIDQYIINKEQKIHFKYINHDNLLFSKSIFNYSILNKDSYYLTLMHNTNKELFFKFCDSPLVLQHAISDIEKKAFGFNNLIFKLNPFFYKQIITYVKKMYQDSFIEEIKFTINSNLLQSKMEIF